MRDFPRDVVTDFYLTIPVHESAPEKLDSYFGEAVIPRDPTSLMGMLSRGGTQSGTCRTVDREVVLRQLQLALLSQLLRSQPSHMVSEATPHEVADFALLRLAEWLGVPVLFFQPSLVGPQVVARSSLTNILDVELPSCWPEEPGCRSKKSAQPEGCDFKNCKLGVERRSSIDKSEWTGRPLGGGRRSRS